MSQSLLPEFSLTELWNSIPESHIRSDTVLIKDIVLLAEQLLQGNRSNDSSQNRITFHCLSTAIQVGLRVLNSPTLTSEVKDKTQLYVVNTLFPRLEEIKKSLVDGSLNEKQDLKEMQNMALVLFKGAEDQHIQGRANKETIKSYKQCSTLIQCVKECDANSEPRVFEEKLINVSKEAKIRMINVIKCLKEGRPIPPLEISSASGKGGDASEIDSINSEINRMMISSTSGANNNSSPLSIPPRQLSERGGERNSTSSFQVPTSFSDDGLMNSTGAAGIGLNPAFPPISGNISAAALSFAQSSFQVSRVSSNDSSISTGASASASKGFVGNVALADAHEYSKFVVTALKYERNAQVGLHFATLALNSIRQGSFLQVPHASRSISDKAVLHACAAVDALSGGNKVMTQPELAIKELFAVIAELGA